MNPSIMAHRPKSQGYHDMEMSIPTTADVSLLVMRVLRRGALQNAQVMTERTAYFFLTLKRRSTDLVEEWNHVAKRKATLRSFMVISSYFRFIPHFTAQQPNTMALSTGMIHGLIMMLGFGWLLPLGVLSARCMKHRPANLWYQLHRASQITGLVIGTIGFIVAVKSFDAFKEDHSSTGYKHGAMGVACFVLALLQPLLAVFRPAAESTNRRYWELQHKGLGYALLVLIFATILMGAKMEGPSWQLAYVFGVVGSLVLAAGLMWYDRFSYTAQSSSGEATGAEITTNNV